MKLRIESFVFVLAFSVLAIGCADDPESNGVTQAASTSKGDTEVDGVKTRFTGTLVDESGKEDLDYGVVLFNNDEGAIGTEEKYMWFTYSAVKKEIKTLTVDILGCTDESKLQIDGFDVSVTVEENTGEVDAIFFGGKCGDKSLNCLAFFTDNLLEDGADNYFVDLFQGVSGGCNVIDKKDAIQIKKQAEASMIAEISN